MVWVYGVFMGSVSLDIIVLLLLGFAYHKTWDNGFAKNNVNA